MSKFHLLCLLAVMGCADGEPAIEDPTIEDPTDHPKSPSKLEVLAKIERGKASVQWVRPPNAPPGTGAVVISGRTDESPLLDLDTAEKLRPVELYLALSTDTRIPAALEPYATDDDRALFANAAELAKLRGRITERAAHLARKIAVETPAIQMLAGTCTAGQIATARTVFGNGYTASSTCGDHLGFITSSPTYWYCNGGDCEYGLGEFDGASCPLSNPCDFAQGKVTTRAMRSNTNGNPHFVNSGHRIRGFAYNCTGNGSLTMQLRYGGGDWDTEVSVGPGFHTGVYVWGSGLLQERAPARSWVANGNIFDGIPASGATFQPVEYNITGNAGADDKGIFCTDTQQSFSIIATSFPANCGHGLVSWCNDNCGGCFE